MKVTKISVADINLGYLEHIIVSHINLKKITQIEINHLTCYVFKEADVSC